MNNFLIGQFNTFDEDKFKRDFKENFWGIEATMFNDDKEIEKLLKYREEHDFSLGIHFPLRKGIWDHRDPQYLSPDHQVRSESISYMTTEFKYLEKLKPDYVLTHYPKPVILDERTDWLKWGWRFHHEAEYMYNSDYSYERLKSDSEIFFKWFLEQSNTYGFKPILELDNIPTFLHETSLLEDLLDKYNIGLCVDIGRLHLQDCIDNHFDAKVYLKKIAKYVVHVHLWNVQVAATINNSHYPALRTLKVSDGWADVKTYFEILRQESSFNVLFEHQSQLISDEELSDLYNWIDELYNGA